MFISSIKAIRREAVDLICNGRIHSLDSKNATPYEWLHTLHCLTNVTRP